MRSCRFLVHILVLILALGPLYLMAAPAERAKFSPKKKAATSAAAKARKKRATLARRKRLSRAFAASIELRPMAQQLLQTRTPAAYVGVERFAAAHAKDDAGALAWLAVGYAHTLDGEYANAIEPLKSARAHAGEVGDYVDYFLAISFSATAQAEEVITTLKEFATRYPDSLLLGDATVMLANAMVATGDASGAISLLETRRTPARSNVELAVGRAFLRAGNVEGAVESFYRIFYTMPNSDEADAANAELQVLAQGGPVTPPTTALRKMRADLLLQNRRPGDAAPEYQALLQQTTGAEIRPLQMALSVALYRSGKNREASELLERMEDLPDNINSQRLFYLLETSRPDQQKVGDLVWRLRATAPDSQWFQEGLLSSANMYLLKKDLETAARFYGELADRFPEGKYGPYATWKMAWLQLRMGKQGDASNTLERYISLYPQGGELTATLYWRGRLAEDQEDLSKARAYYTKLSERFRNTYYAALARERLQEIPNAGETADEPLLRKISAPQPAKIAIGAPTDDLRVQKSKLLGNAGLVDFAVRELQQAASSDSEWLAAESAQLYSSSGKYHRALQTVKRAVPGYYAFEFSELPRPLWEYLFPKAYWQDLRRYASANGLDPFLVASLIRQESEFNAEALSRANAMGLMQILPGTGKKVAKELKLRGFNNSLLLDPTYNLQLGTRYFRDLLKKYDGRVEYALAAYNAGADRVDEWKKDSYRDMPEFVESIPFTETREYVQAIVRNVGVYQRLYQDR